MLTSNLPFSGWSQISEDSMMTAAAVERLVHHSVIVELNMPHYRRETANVCGRTDERGDSDGVAGEDHLLAV